MTAHNPHSAPQVYLSRRPTMDDDSGKCWHFETDGIWWGYVTASTSEKAKAEARKRVIAAGGGK